MFVSSSTIYTAKSLGRFVVVLSYHSLEASELFVVVVTSMKYYVLTCKI